MKSSIVTKSVMGILVMAALTLSACAKKDDSAARAAGRGGAGAVPTSTQNTCPAGTQTLGKIFGSNSGSSFEQQVKAFVSANLDPNSLGTISGGQYDKTGVDFEASFPFDVNGKLVKESATMTMKIFDSYAKDIVDGKELGSYNIPFQGAESGTIDRNSGRVTVVFKDGYGTITVTGTYQVNNPTGFFDGTISFSNLTNVTGAAPAAGQLGQFRIIQCAAIKNQ